MEDAAHEAKASAAMPDKNKETNCLAAPIHPSIDQTMVVTRQVAMLGFTSLQSFMSSELASMITTSPASVRRATRKPCANRADKNNFGTDIRCSVLHFRSAFPCPFCRRLILVIFQRISIFQTPLISANSVLHLLMLLHFLRIARAHSSVSLYVCARKGLKLL